MQRCAALWNERNARRVAGRGKAHGLCCHTPPAPPLAARERLFFGVRRGDSQRAAGARTSPFGADLVALAVVSLCVASCIHPGVSTGNPPRVEPVPARITAIYDVPERYRGVVVRVRGWAATGFNVCTFHGQRCTEPPRVLACERRISEQVTIDKPAVTTLELRSADGSPLGGATGLGVPPLRDGVFYEVVGTVHASPELALWLRSARAANAETDDCLPPTSPGGSQ